MLQALVDLLHGAGADAGRRRIAFALALVRYGIVAMIVAVVSNGILVSIPMTLDPDRWYSGSTVLAFALIGAASCLTL